MYIHNNTLIWENNSKKDIIWFKIIKYSMFKMLWLLPLLFSAFSLKWLHFREKSMNTVTESAIPLLKVLNKIYMKLSLKASLCLLQISHERNQLWWNETLNPLSSSILNHFWNVVNYGLWTFAIEIYDLSFSFYQREWKCWKQ